MSTVANQYPTQAELIRNGTDRCPPPGCYRIIVTDLRDDIEEKLDIPASPFLVREEAGKIVKNDKFLVAVVLNSQGWLNFISTPHFEQSNMSELL